MKKNAYRGYKNDSHGILSNNKGQFLIESMLLLVVLLGIFMFITNYVRGEKLISKLLANPITNISAMTAYGTWRSDGCTGKNGNNLTIGKCHPNSIHRSLSSSPRE